MCVGRADGSGKERLDRTDERVEAIGWDEQLRRAEERRSLTSQVRSGIKLEHIALSVQLEGREPHNSKRLRWWIEGDKARRLMVDSS